MKNNKGFTLIEILAVVVIIAVLALTAIPNVNRLIESSRKKNFISDAKTYINVFRNGIAAREYMTVDESICSIPKSGYYSAIQLNQLDLENGTAKSPWGYEYSGYVVIINKETSTAPIGSNKVGIIEYYFIGHDTGQNGIFNLVKESDLSTKDVVNISALNEKNTKNETIIPNIQAHKPIKGFHYDTICKSN
ncbi:MAG: type II secretion system protein [Bacilli bacterium]|nr:type II secretion system protein [Bacilli bacterium]